MSENKDVRELNPDKLEQFSGSDMDITHLGSCGVCMHEGMYKTGAQREDPRWLFFSQHQFEYYCPKCKETIWVDEEP